MKHKKELLELADLWERRAKSYKVTAQLRLYKTELEREQLYAKAEAYEVSASELRERLEKEQNDEI